MDLLRTGMIGKLMPDDALLHELVHTLRMMSGQATTLDLGALRYTQRWGNTEELYAVLIANTYVSERNGRYGSRQPLRGNVGPVDQFTPLSADKARSQVFLKTYRPLLKERILRRLRLDEDLIERQSRIPCEVDVADSRFRAEPRRLL